MGIDEIAMLRDGREAMTREQCLDFTAIDGQGKPRSLFHMFAQV